jgi:hypothetical protein
VPFEVVLTDQDGGSRTEVVPALVLPKPISVEEQVLVTSGAKFLEQFKEPSGRELRVQRRRHDDAGPASKRIKREEDG